MKIKNYSKKMVITALTLFSISLPSIVNAQEIEPCSNLFISKIVKDNEVDSLGTPYSNYVIEVFNPRSTSVNGSNYELRFTDANAVVTIVPLKGTIAAKSTFAISHTNAENNVLALMDADTTALDFSIYTEVKLVHKPTSTVLDAFGMPLPQSFITFNYLLFMQDPEGYLATYDLTLADLDHIDLRRGFFVTKGTPVFNENDVIGTWAFYTGTDHTDLNKHNCLCNEKPGATPTVGYKYASKTLDEKTSLNNAVDDLDLLVSSYAGTPLYITQLLTGGNAVVNTHIVYYQQNAPNPNNCSYANAGPNCTYARTLNNLFVGNKTINSVIQPSQFATFNVDPTTKSHAITIRGNGSTGVKEHDYSILPITIFPSTTSDILNVNGSIDCKYFITSLDGKQVQEGALYNSATINVSLLASGMYIINFYNYSGKKTDKFIKD
jgi:hypothetical protein